MITIIQGPMWAGKTTKLLELIGGKSRPVCFDCCNSRNTERDLHKILICMDLDESVDYKYCDLVVFDEVHLASVFKKDDLLLSQLREANKRCDVILAGLLYDFFSHYEWFPIWEKIENEYGKQAQHIWLHSFKPCCECNKKDSSVIYTKKLDSDLENRVGDNYGNICWDCAWNGEKKTRHRSIV